MPVMILPMHSVNPASFTSTELFSARAIYVQKDHKTTTEQIQIVIVDLMDMELAKAAQRLV